MLIQAQPIVARIVETPAEQLTIVDLLLSVFGLTVVLLLSAAFFGALLGGVLIAIRKLRDRHAPAEPPTPLRIT